MGNSASIASSSSICTSYSNPYDIDEYIYGWDPQKITCGKLIQVPMTGYTAKVAGTVVGGILCATALAPIGLGIIGASAATDDVEHWGLLLETGRGYYVCQYPKVQLKKYKSYSDAVKSIYNNCSYQYGNYGYKNLTGYSNVSIGDIYYACKSFPEPDKYNALKHNCQDFVKHILLKCGMNYESNFHGYYNP